MDTEEVLYARNVETGTNDVPITREFFHEITKLLLTGKLDKGKSIALDYFETEVHPPFTVTIKID
jgi:hypothetical protein